MLYRQLFFLSYSFLSPLPSSYFLPPSLFPLLSLSFSFFNFLFKKTLLWSSNRMNSSKGLSFSAWQSWTNVTPEDCPHTSIEEDYNKYELNQGWLQLCPCVALAPPAGTLSFWLQAFGPLYSLMAHSAFMSKLDNNVPLWQADSFFLLLNLKLYCIKHSVFYRSINKDWIAKASAPAALVYFLEFFFFTIKKK